MQARQIGRPNAASQARLQVILVALAGWNLLTFLLELTSSSLLHVGDVDGALGVRAVGGSVLVLAIAYVYAARNPVRYRFILWLASVEQLVTIFAATFHLARGDVNFGESFVPVVVAIVFLMLLMVNLPRQTEPL